MSDPPPDDLNEQRQTICDCGHPLSDHAHSGWGRHTVCTVKLDDPDRGWHGVCPCVRTDADIARDNYERTWDPDRYAERHGNAP